MQPLEIKDFSGGQTDNILQGEAQRAARLFNLFIGIDHKLYSRQGSLVQPNAKKSARIDSINTWDNMRELVYSSAGNFYDPTGAAILGPTGNIAFPGLDPNAQITTAEFQKQLIIATDTQTIPEKIYRNASNVLTLNTVGLPETKGTPTFTDSALLAQCISSANSLKAKFLAHIEDAHTNTERVGTVNIQVTAGNLTGTGAVTGTIIGTLIIQNSTTGYIAGEGTFNGGAVDGYCSMTYTGTITGLVISGTMVGNVTVDGVIQTFTAGVFSGLLEGIDLTNIDTATYQPVNSTNRHWAVDKYAKSYLTATTFYPGEYTPVNPIGPAADATDYNSLVFLCQCLSLAFEEHRFDSAGNPPLDQSTEVFLKGLQRYHAIGYLTPFTDGTYGRYGIVDTNNVINFISIPTNQGIQQKLSYYWDPQQYITDAIPLDQVYTTQLTQIATFLDDFLIKFWLHEYAPCIHRYPVLNTGIIGGAVSLTDMIGPISTDGSPIVVASPFNFWYASNYITRALTNHVMATDSFQQTFAPTAGYTALHTTQNIYANSGLPFAGYYLANIPSNPTSQQQAVALISDTILAQMNIFTTRYLFQQVHTFDLQWGSNSGLADVASANSTAPYNIQLTIHTAGGPYTTATAGQVLQASYENQISVSPLYHYGMNGIYGVISSTGGSYDVCYEASTVPTGVAVGTFVMHPYFLLSGMTPYPSFTTGTQWLQLGYGTAPTLGDLASWATLISDFVTSFADHLNSTNIHYQSSLSDTPEYQQSNSALPAGQVEYFYMYQIVPTNLKNTFWQPFYIPTMATYGYAFIYDTKYVVGTNGIEYEVDSNPVYSSAVYSEETFAAGTIVTAAYGSSIALSLSFTTPVAFIFNVPTLTNTADTNYDVANITNYIYRTTGNGQTYYRIHPITPGPFTTPITPTITPVGLIDVASDTTNADTFGALQNSQDIIYTNGNVDGSYQPPACNFVWTANDYYYYGGVMDGTQFLANRVIQSEQLAPDWAPGTNYIDFDSDVVGGGAARNVNIVLTTTGVFRIEGQFGTDGSGAITKNRISNQVGGINAMSVVPTEIGLFFAGTDGFYYTDGYQMIKISIELNQTYQNATATDAQKRCVTGRYDRTMRRILWTMQSDSTKTDCDVIYCFDLNFGTKPSGFFSILFGATGSWNPSAIGFLDRVLYIGDADGYLYNLDANTKTDPLKNTAIAPNLWTTTYLPWEWRSVQLDFGSNSVRKFFSRIHHVGKDVGNVAIEYYTIADGEIFETLAPIRYDTVGPGSINDQWRRVGGKKLRAGIYQVGARNGQTTIYKSDDYPTLVPEFISNVAGVTTVQFHNIGSPPVQLGTDTVGMTLGFSSDFYCYQWPILTTSLSGSDTVITVTDTLNELQYALTAEWQIKGYLKDQAFSLASVDIWYGEQGNLGDQYRGESSSQGGGGNKS